MYRSLLFLFALLFITNTNAQERINIHHEGLLENIWVEGISYSETYPSGFNYIFTADRLNIRTNDFNSKIFESYHISLNSTVIYDEKLNIKFYTLDTINPHKEKQFVFVVLDTDTDKIIQITLHKTEKHEEIYLKSKDLDIISKMKIRKAKKQK